MTYQELAVQVRRLPLRERLDLLDVLTRSLRNDLPVTHTESVLAQIRGIGKPAGVPPSDAEVEADTERLQERAL